MKLTRARAVFPLALSLLIVAAGGCGRHSTNAPPAGTFRLAVGDASYDSASRTVPVKVTSAQPAWIAVVNNHNQGRSEADGQLLITDPDKLHEAQVFLSAVRTNAPGPSIQAGVRVKTEGGDGDMLIKGGFESSGASVYPAPADAALEHFVQLTATNGIYPLNQPLEIARIDGQPVIMTVGDQKK